ncbi:SRPBCC family protein [Streptomyces sp. NPDC058067]|uniref:SRPBCC family protein n=1 Tax=Streptomyces sp. NPDC058067 TaxID=3346324 RepID=UPI0036EB7E31
MAAPRNSGKWLTGALSASFRAPPDDVFALVTDLDRLPEWNRAVTEVLDRPAALAPGAEWVVRVRPAGLPSWRSRSWLEELDPQRRVFRHRSKADDKNPSHAEWLWQVDEEPEGSRLTVSWELHPMTAGRKFLAAPLRGRMLVTSEVPDSLAALARMLASGE